MTMQPGVADEPVKEPLVVFLVRHAEKLDASRDPVLTAAGKRRANELASTLRSAKLSQVHSTDLIRTRETAAPVAAVHNLPVQLYDARDLPAFVTKLRQTGGRHLVVGHSTTTPGLVKLLGGEAQADFDEAGEFDRLYVLTVGTNGQTIVVLLRYGQPFQAASTASSALDASAIPN